MKNIGVSFMLLVAITLFLAGCSGQFDSYIITVVEPNGNVWLSDINGNQIKELDCEDARGYSEGLIAVQIDGEWGYMDLNGSIQIPCSYSVAYDFHNGIARVKRGGRYGYIDRKGEEVTPCTYYDANDFSEGLAAVQIDGRYGYINTKGKLVIPSFYYDTYGFSEGLAWVEQDDRLGYINTKGEMIIPTLYTSASPFSEGLAWVGQNGERFYIDKKGNRVNIDTYSLLSKFSEGKAIVMKEDIRYRRRRGYSYNNNFIIIDKKGNAISSSSLKCYSVGTFSDGFAYVKGREGYGYVDEMSNLAIPCMYSEAEDFKHGIAVVKEKKGLYGVIDKHNQTVIPFIAENIYISK